MTFGPEKPPLPPGTLEENPKKETPEGAMETSERMSKSLKAFIAVSGALLWGEYKFLSRIDPLGELNPGGELSKKDEKKVQEKGWIGTMTEKARHYYQTIGKVEDAVEAVRAGKWDYLKNLQ